MSIRSSSGDSKVSPAPRTTARCVQDAEVKAELEAVPNETVAFPTEQRKRQKAQKEAGHIARKRPQVVEQHHDDCGEDFGPLGQDYLSMPDLSDDGNSEDEHFCALSWDFGMNGSGCVPKSFAEVSESNTPMVFEDLESFLMWDRTSDNSSDVHTRIVTDEHVSCHSSDAHTWVVPDDVAQLCGGAGGTAHVLIRRGWKSGPNFDIVVGFDLMQPNGRVLA